jgi:hypothetical protein
MAQHLNKLLVDARKNRAKAEALAREEAEW